MFRTIAIFLTLALAGSSLGAQQTFFSRWQARASATQAQQPGWCVPLVTPYPALIQVARLDFFRQQSPTHTSTWNFDGSKGFNLVPFARTELDVSLPPYLQHNSPSAKDGFGDMSFLLKYRFLSGNERHGNYVVSAYLQATIPTGRYKNGSTDATLIPTVGLGKGFGRFDIQSTLGATLPTGNTQKLGRVISWNVATQYHLGRYLWPELEFNTSYFRGGSNDGRVQAFATPGLMLGKFRVNHRDSSRQGIALGGGMLIATSAYHAYNHGLVFTGRYIF